MEQNEITNERLETGPRQTNPSQPNYCCCCLYLNSTSLPSTHLPYKRSEAVYGFPSPSPSRPASPPAAPRFLHKFPLNFRWYRRGSHATSCFTIRHIHAAQAAERRKSCLFRRFSVGGIPPATCGSQQSASLLIYDAPTAHRTFHRRKCALSHL